MEDRENLSVGCNVAQTMMERKETETYHNTYQWEQMFYERIRQGDPEQLEAFLLQDAAARLNRGTMAETPLRQAKICSSAQLQKLVCWQPFPPAWMWS